MSERDPLDQYAIHPCSDPAVIEQAKREHAARMADAKKRWAALRRQAKQPTKKRGT